MSVALTDESLMPWGKYKGEEMIDVPASYLLWLVDSGTCKDGVVYDYIMDNEDALKKEVNGG